MCLKGCFYVVESVSDDGTVTLTDLEKPLTLEQVSRCLRLSYAVTYASCQGLTLSGRVRLHMHSLRFPCRHLYVGSSRATAADLLEVVSAFKLVCSVISGTIKTIPRNLLSVNVALPCALRRVPRKHVGARAPYGGRSLGGPQDQREPSPRECLRCACDRFGEAAEQQRGQDGLEEPEGLLP